MPTLETLATIVEKPLGLTNVQSSTLVGLQPEAISVEVGCSRGPAFFQMVGLAQTPVREARVRVTSALSRIGVLLEEWAITVNLAPADLRKKDAALDLAIALGILGAIGELPPESVGDALLLGELSLEGKLQPIRGVLPQLIGARDRGLRTVVVPAANAREAGLVTGLRIHLAEYLGEVAEHFRGAAPLPTAKATLFEPEDTRLGPDLSDVRGQSVAKRALEVAAAGHHNLLMVGPPGAGKTMLARRLPSILPPLTYAEALECTSVHSIAGLIQPETGVLLQRPFRAPHHSVTEQGLIGGGESPRPGEVSLAHHGVLFLDEFPEFRRPVLEALRQPLEDRKVLISRARARATFPAAPLVVAAMNPCPCGYLGHPSRSCVCSIAQRDRYRARLSGPLLDRLDVHITMPPVALSSMTSPQGGEDSKTVRARVVAARERQWHRHRRGLTEAHNNAELSQADFRRTQAVQASALELLERAAERLGLSARAFTKVLRVARTVADLEASDAVRTDHVAEALQGRLLEARGRAR